MRNICLFDYLNDKRRLREDWDEQNSIQVNYVNFFFHGGRKHQSAKARWGMVRWRKRWKFFETFGMLLRFLTASSFLRISHTLGTWCYFLIEEVSWYTIRHPWNCIRSWLTPLSISCLEEIKSNRSETVIPLRKTLDIRRKMFFALCFWNLLPLKVNKF